MLNYETKNIGNLDYNLTVFKCVHCTRSYFSLERLSLHVEENHIAASKHEATEDMTFATSNKTESPKKQNHENVLRFQRKYLRRLIKHWPPQKAMRHWKKRFPDINWKRRIKSLISPSYNPQRHDHISVKTVLELANIQFNHQQNLNQLRNLEVETGLSNLALRSWFRLKNPVYEKSTHEKMVHSILMNEFMKSSYPSDEVLHSLVIKTRMDSSAVNTWFILQRAKTNSMDFTEAKEKKLWMWFLPNASEIPGMTEDQLSDISQEVGIPTSDVRLIFNCWMGHLSKLKNFIDYGEDDCADQLNGKGICYQTMVLQALNKFRVEQSSLGIPIPGGRKKKVWQEEKSFKIPTTVVFLQSLDTTDWNWDSFKTYLEERTKIQRPQKNQQAGEDMKEDSLMKLFETTSELDSSSNSGDNLLLNKDVLSTSYEMTLKVQGSVFEKPNLGKLKKVDSASSNLFQLFTSTTQECQQDSCLENDMQCESDFSDDDVIFVSEIAARSSYQKNVSEPKNKTMKLDRAASESDNLSVGVFNEIELGVGKARSLEGWLNHDKMDEESIQNVNGNSFSRKPFEFLTNLDDMNDCSLTESSDDELNLQIDENSHEDLPAIVFDNFFDALNEPHCSSSFVVQAELPSRNNQPEMADKSSIAETHLLSIDDEVHLTQIKQSHNLHRSKHQTTAAPSRQLHLLSIDEISPPPGKTKVKKLRCRKKSENAKHNLKIKIKTLQKMQQKR